ncbi:Wadjet anti-phage system protein JetD domain-containing protein [Treponema succinifaciens]|uniref:Wadjet anti-phage system protein JetD domain-containing protein n=1 Tax=Treponema succinifaciens TaxID=167 RepID=UPI0023F1BEDD|nr:Wadjet anti-phage system protein JetD domain-containing protein [Treponema succinifaciens]
MTFSQKQKKTLELLLKKYESSKTYNKNNEITQSFSILPEKIFPDYTNDFADVDKIHDFENDLEVLEKMELVTISKKDDRISKIAAISTDENWNKIRQILGVKDKNTRLKEEISFYSAIYDDSDFDKIAKDFCRQQIERLEVGKKAQFFQEEAEKIITLLNYILKNKNEILERELSISILSNSKTWEEKYKKKVLKILRQNERFASFAENCADEKETDKAILEECNIFSNPSYVYFKGSGTITFDNGNCISLFSDIPLALSSAAINKITAFEIIDKKIMTVENLTSFNRIKKSDIFFIFLSGYHNSAKQAFLSKIFRQNSNKEYYHFGDIDPDGFFILDNLRSKTQIDFKAYKMGIAELQKYSSYTRPLEENDLRKAKSLIAKEKYTEILDYMLKHNVKLEQEIISWKEAD